MMPSNSMIIKVEDNNVLILPYYTNYTLIKLYIIDFGINKIFLLINMDLLHSPILETMLRTMKKYVNKDCAI